jgi:hypothetical protein
MKPMESLDRGTWSNAARRCAMVLGFERDEPPRDFGSVWNTEQ